jgi:hypothetical protein
MVRHVATSVLCMCSWACAASSPTRGADLRKSIEISEETLYNGGLRVDRTYLVFTPQRTTVERSSGGKENVLRRSVDVTTEECRYSHVQQLVGRVHFVAWTNQNAVEEEKLPTIHREVVWHLRFHIDGARVVPAPQTARSPAFAEFYNLYHRCTAHLPPLHRP